MPRADLVAVHCLFVTDTNDCCLELCFVVLSLPDPHGCTYFISGREALKNIRRYFDSNRRWVLLSAYFHILAWSVAKRSLTIT